MALNMPFERSGTQNATDYSGYGNNGTVTGGVWSANGDHDASGAFVFSNNYVTLNNDSEINSNQFAIAAWAKFSSTGGYQSIITKRTCCGDDSTQLQWSMQTNNDNRLWFGVRSGSATYW